MKWDDELLEKFNKLLFLQEHPGVENKKLSVVMNSPIASALPRADNLGENGRRAIMTAMAISSTPRQLENARTLKK
jgi:hypothetical protein